MLINIPKALEDLCLASFENKHENTLGDMLTSSEHKKIDTLESIKLGDENDRQDDVDICEYDGNTLKQKTLVELHGIGNVILKERLTKLYDF